MNSVVFYCRRGQSDDGDLTVQSKTLLLLTNNHEINCMHVNVYANLTTLLYFTPNIRGIISLGEYRNKIN